MTCDITEKNHALAELENYVSGLLPTDIVPFEERESVLLFFRLPKDSARFC